MPIKTLFKIAPIFLAVWAVSVPQQANAQTAIIDKGAPLATIYIDAKAAPPVNIAANDLQTYLKQITGAKLPIVTDAAKLKGFVIYLGDTAMARKQGIETDKLPPDGFRILSNKDWMVIAGKDYNGPVMTSFTNPFRANESFNRKLNIGAFGNAGTLFGVYHFLETNGVRWYMPGPLGTVVPRKTKIVVPALNLRQAPYFPQRHCYYDFMELSEEETLWYRRAGYGSPVPIPVMHSFGPFFHKYKDTHPEYFAIIDGQRDFTNLSTAEMEGNYNLSDPGFIQQAIDDANKYFDDNPDQDIYPLCPSDGMSRISEDPVSQAQIDKSQGPGGEFSNYVWGFINKVAKGIQAKHPDKFIGGFAYERYTKPPTNIDKLEPNVVLVITKMRARYPIGTYKKDTEEKIAGWAKKVNIIYNWEYYCNPLFNAAWQGYPMFFSKLLQDDLKSLKGISRGEFIEAESWTPDAYATAPDKIKINYPGVDSLLLYTTARLLWNPDMDVKAMLSEYYKLFYGPAEQPMRAFWEGVEDNWNKKGWQNGPNQVYSTAFSNQLMSNLEQAKAKTAVGSVYRQRIELILSEFSPAAKIAARLEKLPKPALDVPLLGMSPATGASLPALAPGAPVISFLDRRGETASPATNAQVAYDQSNLYVDIRCYEPNMAKLKTLAKGRDNAGAPIWEDDAVEIFVAPDADHPEKTVHYIVSAGGAFYDATVEAPMKENTAWNGNAKVTVQKEENRWIARLAIPWRDLGIQNVQAGQKLAAGFYRTRYAGSELMESGWAPMPNSSYYSPQDFGTLTLQDTVLPETVPTSTLNIQPPTAQEFGSGAGFLGLYYAGGIPNTGLFVGHANSSPRGDRAVFKFDLRPLLESGDKIEKTELVFSVYYVTGKNKERTINVRYFPVPVGTLDADTLGTDETEDLATFKVNAEDAFAATSAAKSEPVLFRTDVTSLIKDAVAKGRTEIVMRWQDVQAEKDGPERDAVGIGLSENGSGGLPHLTVTLKQP